MMALGNRMGCGSGSIVFADVTVDMGWHCGNRKSRKHGVAQSRWLTPDSWPKFSGAIQAGPGQMLHGWPKFTYPPDEE